MKCQKDSKENMDDIYKRTFIFFGAVKEPIINFLLRDTSFVASDCFQISQVLTFFFCFKSGKGLLRMQAKLRFSLFLFLFLLLCLFVGTARASSSCWVALNPSLAMSGLQLVPFSFFFFNHRNESLTFTEGTLENSRVVYFVCSLHYACSQCSAPPGDLWLTLFNAGQDNLLKSRIWCLPFPMNRASATKPS